MRSQNPHPCSWRRSGGWLVGAAHPTVNGPAPDGAAPTAVAVYRVAPRRLERQRGPGSRVAVWGAGWRRLARQRGHGGREARPWNAGRSATLSPPRLASRFRFGARKQTRAHVGRGTLRRHRWSTPLGDGRGTGAHAHADNRVPPIQIPGHMDDDGAGGAVRVSARRRRSCARVCSMQTASDDRLLDQARPILVIDLSRCDICRIHSKKIEMA